MKKNFSQNVLFRVLLFLFFISITQLLYSQADVEKATRETDRLGRQEEEMERRFRRPPPQKPAPPQAEVAAPAKKEEKFFIKKINLTGTEHFLPEDFQPIIAKYENKEVTLTDLNNLAKEIEQEYIRRGIIAAVFVPPQEIKEQSVTLQTVEARMGSLQIQDAKYFSKERLKYYWKIPKSRVLDYERLSKSVQIMNKNPDRQVKASLRAGTKPGTTDVVLTPTTHFPVHFFSTFDTEGATSTGKSRIGLGTRHNNFLGLDDTLLAGYTFGNSFSGTYFYHSLPVTPDGTTLIYGYSRSLSKPLKEFAPYNLTSQAKNTTISLHQDLYSKDNYVGEAYVGFAAKDKTTKMIQVGTSATPYNRDRQRIFNLGANFLWRDTQSITTVAPEYFQGVNAFGANEGALASRGANATFSKFNLDVKHRRLLPLNLQASLRSQGQIASTKLTPQEELGLGGIDSVRGYPSMDYEADSGIINSAEIISPLYLMPQSWRLPFAKEPLRNQATLVAFVDQGWGLRRGALATEQKSVNYIGIGAGMRVRLYDQALLRLEWGFPVGDKMITEGGKSQFHFSVEFQDKLPEEIEYVKMVMEEENIKRLAWQLVNEQLAKPAGPLGKKLYGYMYQGQRAYKRGDLKKSKKFYEEVEMISRSLYQQAEDYVRTTFQQQKELREYNRLALVSYKAGKKIEAVQLWHKVLNQAKVKPLVLEF